MKNLTIYTPAEVLFLKNPNQRSLRDPLKLTLFDLLLKQVLTTVPLAKATHPRDPLSTANYIAPGNCFKTHQHQPHELFFTLPYVQMPSAKILFRHLVQMAFDSAKSSRNYLKVLFKGRLGGLVKHGGWRDLFTWYSLNSEGKKMNSILQDEITTLDNSVLQNNKDPKTILNYSSSIHGNICLLPSVNFSLYQEIERLFPAEQTGNSLNSCSSSCGSWSTFDSSCSSGCGSNGCSGSGCSSGGCSSGCGGGCGGGCSS